jgi:hypothetical protein
MERVEDLALHRLVLGRRLDHDVAVAEGFVGERRPDAIERRLAVGAGDGALRDLAGHVAADRGEPLLDLVLGDVVEAHLEPGERADMGDAVAHLSGADDADGLDLGSCALRHSPAPRRASRLCP